MMFKQRIEANIACIIIIAFLAMSPAVYAEEYEGVDDIAPEEAVIMATDVQYIASHFAEALLPYAHTKKDQGHAFTVTWDVALEDEHATMADLEVFLEESMAAHHGYSIDEVHILVDETSQEGKDPTSLVKYIIIYE